MSHLSSAEQYQSMKANESIEASRRGTFRAATKGMRAYTIALKLRDARVCPGVDFRGCTKRAIEDEFVDGDFLGEVTGQQLRNAMDAHR